MAVTELESFISKFKSLWNDGHQAKLTVNSRNGKAWINLEVGLECPRHRRHEAANQGQGHDNARKRRKERRAADRAVVTAEEAAKATAASNEHVGSDSVEMTAKTSKDAPEKIGDTEANEDNNEVSTLKDEFCGDDIYEEKNDDNKDTNETLVEQILVTPDCQADWRDDYVTKLVHDKLKAIGIIMTKIQINRSNRKAFTSCVVFIKPIESKKITEANFPLRNWTLKII